VPTDPVKIGLVEAVWARTPSEDYSIT